MTTRCCASFGAIPIMFPTCPCVRPRICFWRPVETEPYGTLQRNESSKYLKRFTARGMHAAHYSIIFACLNKQTLECATGWMFGRNEIAGEYGRRSACYFRQYWFGLCSHGCHGGRSRKCKYSANTCELSVVSLDTYSKKVEVVSRCEQPIILYSRCCLLYHFLRSLTIYHYL